MNRTVPNDSASEAWPPESDAVQDDACNCPTLHPQLSEGERLERRSAVAHSLGSCGDSRESSTDQQQLHAFEEVSIEFVGAGFIDLIAAGRSHPGVIPRLIALSPVSCDGTELRFALIQSRDPTCDSNGPDDAFQLRRTVFAATLIRRITVVGLLKTATVELETAQDLIALHVARDESWNETAPDIPVSIVATEESDAPAEDADDEITWAWVGTQFASGVIGAAGAFAFNLIMNWFLGRGDSMNELAGRLTRAFAQHIRQAVDEATLQRLNAWYLGLQQSFSEYLENSSDAFRRRKLEDALYDSANLVAELQILGLKGHGSFMIAAGLRFAMFQEVMKWAPGEFKNLLKAIRGYNEHAGKMQRERWRMHSEVLVTAMVIETDVLPNGTVRPLYCFTDYGTRLCRLREDEAKSEREWAIWNSPEYHTTKRLLDRNNEILESWWRLEREIRPEVGFPKTLGGLYAVPVSRIGRPVTDIHLTEVPTSGVWYIEELERPLSWNPSAVVCRFRWSGEGSHDGLYLSAGFDGPNFRLVMASRDVGAHAYWEVRPHWNGKYTIRWLNAAAGPSNPGCYLYSGVVSGKKCVLCKNERLGGPPELWQIDW